MIWSFPTCNVCVHVTYTCLPSHTHAHTTHTHICTHNCNDCSRFNWYQLLTVDLVHGFFGIAAYRHLGMSLCVINFTMIPTRVGMRLRELRCNKLWITRSLFHDLEEYILCAYQYYASLPPNPGGLVMCFKWAGFCGEAVPIVWKLITAEDA